ncbi:hypothetical protein [Baekduia sp.]|jgi:hypothetical protein|uniref:hypothetical protein n=1 Tax=Baekduia sp. TaxID=2600305 RepID=UPI002E0677A2|nr:hypothetical protein [Baekduia sp.]
MSEFPEPEHKPRLVITFDDAEPAHAASLPAASLPAAPSPAAPAPPPPDYAICGVREVLEGTFDAEDGYFLPVPGLETDTVLLEPRDGADVRRLHCNEIVVKAGEANKRILRAADIRAQVLLTDARLTIACTKYDKGGGWVGGPVAMIALNAGSKLLAANRRRGKMLVGQIRYPWIHAVYAQNKSGWSGSELLRVIVKARGQLLRLELTFPKDVDATAIATELIRRTAQFRLAHEPDREDAEIKRLHELASVPPLVWRKADNQLAGHQFPSHWPVAHRSARFGLGT